MGLIRLYDPNDVREMMDDFLEPDCDVARSEAFVESEFQRKAAAEASWPSETDCDRLDRVFDRLDEEGICALSNAGYTTSDGPRTFQKQCGRLRSDATMGTAFIMDRMLKGLWMDTAS
jgi:hypothetical protein